MPCFTERKSLTFHLKKGLWAKKSAEKTSSTSLPANSEQFEKVHFSGYIGYYLVPAGIYCNKTYRDKYIKFATKRNFSEVTTIKEKGFCGWTKINFKCFENFVHVRVDRQVAHSRDDHK